MTRHRRFDGEGQDGGDAPTLPFDTGAPRPRLPTVHVIRSAKRRKTIQAREVDGVIQVHIPAWMSEQEEYDAVARMVAKFDRRRDASRIDLAERAAALARRYRLPEPASIRWVDNQNTRWGSCTPREGAIRISSTVAAFPAWVVDYVIVHELCHLRQPDHGREFWKLVARYPKAERARGFLIAKSGGDETY